MRDCGRVADNTHFNVALPPSTVHLPKMFWVALDVKCHGDTHLWTQRGGAKLSFHGAEVFGGTPLHFMSTHNHKGRGQSGKGRIRMQFKTHNTPTQTCSSCASVYAQSCITAGLITICSSLPVKYWN